MIRTLLLSALHAAELAPASTRSPEAVAGFLLRELGDAEALAFAERLVALIRAARNDGPPTLRVVR